MSNKGQRVNIPSLNSNEKELNELTNQISNLTDAVSKGYKNAGQGKGTLELDYKTQGAKQSTKETNDLAGAIKNLAQQKDKLKGLNKTLTDAFNATKTVNVKKINEFISAIEKLQSAGASINGSAIKNLLNLDDISSRKSSYNDDTRVKNIISQLSGKEIGDAFKELRSSGKSNEAYNILDRFRQSLAEGIEQIPQYKTMISNLFELFKTNRTSVEEFGKSFDKIRTEAEIAVKPLKDIVGIFKENPTSNIDFVNIIRRKLGISHGTKMSEAFEEQFSKMFSLDGDFFKNNSIKEATDQLANFTKNYKIQQEQLKTSIEQGKKIKTGTFIDISEFKNIIKMSDEVKNKIGEVYDVIYQRRKDKKGNFLESFRLTGENGYAWVGKDGGLLKEQYQVSNELTLQKQKQKEAEKEMGQLIQIQLEAETNRLRIQKQLASTTNRKEQDALRSQKADESERIIKAQERLIALQKEFANINKKLPFQYNQNGNLTLVDPKLQARAQRNAEQSKEIARQTQEKEKQLKIDSQNEAEAKRVKQIESEITQEASKQEQTFNNILKLQREMANANTDKEKLSYAKSINEEWVRISEAQDRIIEKQKTISGSNIQTPFSKTKSGNVNVVDKDLITKQARNEDEIERINLKKQEQQINSDMKAQEAALNEEVKIRSQLRQIERREAEQQIKTDIAAQKTYFNKMLEFERKASAQDNQKMKNHYLNMADAEYQNIIDKQNTILVNQTKIGKSTTSLPFSVGRNGALSANDAALKAQWTRNEAEIKAAKTQKEINEETKRQQLEQQENLEKQRKLTEQIYQERLKQVQDITDLERGASVINEQELQKELELVNEIVSGYDKLTQRKQNEALAGIRNKYENQISATVDKNNQAATKSTLDADRKQRQMQIQEEEAALQRQRDLYEQIWKQRFKAASTTNEFDKQAATLEEARLRKKLETENAYIKTCSQEVQIRAKINAMEIRSQYKGAVDMAKGKAYNKVLQEEEAIRNRLAALQEKQTQAQQRAADKTYASAETKQLQEVINLTNQLWDLRQKMSKARSTEELAGLIKQDEELSHSLAIETERFKMFADERAILDMEAKTLEIQSNAIGKINERGVVQNRIEGLGTKAERFAIGTSSTAGLYEGIDSWLGKLTEAQGRIAELKTRADNLVNLDWDKRVVEESLLNREYEKENKNLGNIINQINSIRRDPSKRYVDETTISKQIAQMEDFYSKNDGASKRMREQLRGVIDETEKLAQAGHALPKDFDPLVTKFNQLKTEMKKTGDTGMSIMSKLGRAWRSQMASQIAMYTSFYSLIRYAREAFNTIRELDTAMIDLSKTTKMSASEMGQFYYDANEAAKEYGVTTKELIDMASQWSRLGYNDKESSTEMAKMSAQFKMISPGMDVQQSMDGLVSSMKANTQMPLCIVICI